MNPNASERFDSSDFDPSPGPDGTGDEPAPIVRDVGTDLDAANRFAGEVQDRLRFVPGLAWHHWDGRRWAFDTMGRALEEAKQSAQRWTESRLNLETGDLEQRKRMVGLALKMESAAHIKAVLDLAKVDPALVLPHDQLDRDGWLLNVENGTLDLRTGMLRRHDRRDFISKLAPVVFDPDARHNTFDRYLRTLDEAIPEMSEFLARCMGACLTGDCSPESMFLLQGDGASGKTTLTEAFAGILGDYAVKLPFEVFCLSRHGRSPGSASPDLIRLRGARFAFASEGDQSAKLDAGVVKMLTGGDSIPARALYQAPISIPQTWKLWLVSNFDPRAESDDTGLWRRLVKVHFEAIPVAQRDPAIKHALTTDPAVRSALLAWAVRGCLDWQRRGGGRQGLWLLAAVEEATAAYRKKQDTLAVWFDDLLAEGGRLDQGAMTGVGVVRRHYEAWCENSGYSPCIARRFNAFLESRSLRRSRGTGGVWRWEGLQLPIE